MPFAALLCGCASAALSSPPLTSLPTAQPRLVSGQSPLRTGHSQRVAMVLRRERAMELARRYLDAMATRDSTTLTTLFADGVVTGDSGVVEPRSTVVAELSRLFSLSFMISQRMSASERSAQRLNVVSAGEWQSRSVDVGLQSFALHASDWIFEPPYDPRLRSLGVSLVIPSLLVIRFVEGEPLFVARAARRSR